MLKKDPQEKIRNVFLLYSWNVGMIVMFFHTSVGGYLSAGVSSTKLLPGVPLFGHAWYTAYKK